MWFIVTHSVLTFQSQQNFDESTSISSLKQRLYSICGTDPQDMRLQLFNGKDDLICELDSDSKTLGDYGVQEFYRIHVVDTGNKSSSELGFLEDTSSVEKYEMSEEDYDKRENTFRKWKERNIKKPAGAAAKTAQDREQEEQALIEQKGITVGRRCEVRRPNDDLRPRGEVAYVGKVQFAGGYWIGVKLDEPLGKNDGSVQGVRYFDCMNKYGCFVKPDKVEVGDQFTEEDLFDDDSDLEDEI